MLLRNRVLRYKVPQFMVLLLYKLVAYPVLLRYGVLPRRLGLMFLNTLSFGSALTGGIRRCRIRGGVSGLAASRMLLLGIESSCRNAEDCN